MIIYIASLGVRLLLLSLCYIVNFSATAGSKFEELCRCCRSDAGESRTSVIDITQFGLRVMIGSGSIDELSDVL